VLVKKISFNRTTISINLKEGIMIFNNGKDFKEDMSPEFEIKLDELIDNMIEEAKLQERLDKDSEHNIEITLENLWEDNLHERDSDSIPEERIELHPETYEPMSEEDQELIDELWISTINNNYQP